LILVTARFLVAPDAEDEFLAAAAPAIEPTRAEPGCQSYTLLRDVGEPTAFTFVEEWDDSEAFRAHTQSPHLVAFRQAAGPSIASQSVRIHTVEKTRAI
jgi:quinol monooxygenase YgiN